MGVLNEKRCKDIFINANKTATVVLNKIPLLNYDVISHIVKYICRHHERIYPV